VVSVLKLCSSMQALRRPSLSLLADRQQEFLDSQVRITYSQLFSSLSFLRSFSRPSSGSLLRRALIAATRDSSSGRDIVFVMSNGRTRSAIKMFRGREKRKQTKSKQQTRRMPARCHETTTLSLAPKETSFLEARTCFSPLKPSAQQTFHLSPIPTLSLPCIHQGAHHR
jgi:hypothetical protein